MSEKPPIGVVGVGWVGLVTATCFAELGHQVIARDIVAEKVESLARGEVIIHEPGLGELLERNRERLTFTTDMAEVLDGARLLFVCVDTPPTYSGDADLGRVMSVVGELRGHSGHVLVMKSTVPVGTGRKIMRDLTETSYVSCPEFLKEGSAVADFMNPDRVVIGADPGNEEAADAVRDVYAPLGGELVLTDVASAEMIKLSSNAFLATKISFINEIANVCEEVGADVNEVARGMGLDDRIGPKFLKAGIGFGGSCLEGRETVLVRHRGRSELIPLAELFSRFADSADHSADVVHPRDLEVFSWRPGEETGEFLSVSALTRRQFEGDLCEVRTKMGRRVSCTPDHPFVVADGTDEATQVKLAEDLSEGDWVPLAQFAPPGESAAEELGEVLAGAHFVGAEESDVIVRPGQVEIERIAGLPASERLAAVGHPRGLQRSYDIVRSGALRLDEARRFHVDLGSATLGTARNGTYVPIDLTMDERFWRVVGLYIAEGHRSVDGRRHRLMWSFHPNREMELVAEVSDYWTQLGIKHSVRRGTTAMNVSVSSRLLSGWWTGELGLGIDCYSQRIPDLIWDRSESDKRALISGMWMGDGSWSYVNRGPRVVLEYGTASPVLADGLLRLLADLGLVAQLRVARTSKSTCDNFWITISGAEQVERGLEFIKPADRETITASMSRQAKRIAPTGYRRGSPNTAWVRVRQVSRRAFKGPVYSMEVPESETFVTTGGLCLHNCFPKDVSALKMLAGNTGYHFQLLNAVIEVNELQKRRVVAKLEKHLGSLVGKKIALLGFAFKPDTDDMREASSLVLAARLQGEGAEVRGYDPVANSEASELLPTVELAGSAMEALEGADAAVLVTEWPEFADIEWAAAREAMANPLMIDGRNFLDEKVLRTAGFNYEGIGRATEVPGPAT